ncbi:MAG: ABC transporter ATP-binding protein [Leptospiraceae bacterium]|nr:ABC transporter ATP-binding protein [Leptospiraceae bacterium]MCP5496221.1 ABC transporter ATP-binding protein [Leptospiraceae bacterium]
MRIYKRLLKYTVKYRYRLLIGVALAFFVSVFNGVSLTGMIPIFDSLGSAKDYKFKISITSRDKNVLKKQEEGKNLSRLEVLELKLANLKIRVNKKFDKMAPEEIIFLFISLVFPIYLLKLFCLTGAIFFINSTGFMAVKDLRLDIYRKVQIMPLNFFVREKTGILMSRIINDVEIVGKIISSDLKDTITDFFYIVTHVLLLLFLSWKLCLLAFFVIPLVMSPISIFTKKIRRATARQQERLSALNGHLQEVIAGIRVIRAFSMESWESSRFFKINNELSKKTFKGHFYHQIGPAIIELSGALVSVVFLAYGAYLIEESHFSKGMFMAFFLTLLFLMRPLKKLSLMYNLIQSAVSAGERVFELIDAEPDIAESDKPLNLPKLKNGIEYKNVSYCYPGSDKPAIKNINLYINKGDTIAIVGHSGAGKSTIADLLPRLVDPTDGAVLIDDVDIRNYRVRDIRRRIGIVSQNVFLFNGTIKENIAYGNTGISEEKIVAAAKKAHAMEFIQSFEHGFDTMVGERGVMLSGGQRQRISIARALLLDPEILILDEATSSLDTESERLVQKFLEDIDKNRTTIIIAHRLSTTQVANKVYYISEGEIIESGTHSELMQLENGNYKNLYNLQFSE